MDTYLKKTNTYFIRFFLDAVGAATLRRCKAGTTLRRCWRCDASFSNSARSVALQLDALDVYTGHGAMPQHQGTPELNNVSLLSCLLGMFMIVSVLNA